MTAGLFRPAPAFAGSASRAIAPRDVEMFVSETHSLALENVVASLRAGSALTVLVGEAGLGKTIVLNAAIAALAEGPEPVTVLKVSEPLPPPLEFQKLIGAPLGLLDADRMTPNEIARRLAEDPSSTRRVMLAVDDAQTLAPATLLYLRLVSDLFRGRGPLLQILLVGRPGLLETLRRPELAGRFVDSAGSVGLRPLTAMEMQNYIAYRLAACGCTLRGSMRRGVLRRIIGHAEGVPRRADQILQRGLRRGPDGLCRPVTMAMLRELGVAPPVWLPGRAVWAGAAMLAVAGGLVAWQGVDRSRAWLQQARGQAWALAELTMGGAPPAPTRVPVTLAPPDRAAAPPPDAAPLPGGTGTAAADAEIDRLMQAADAQIAAGRLSAPPGDNLMQTFQQLNDLIPTASAAARRTVETMNTHFAERARAAELAGRTEEARRFRQFAGEDAPPPAPAAAPAPGAPIPAAPTLDMPSSAPVAGDGTRESSLPLNAPTRLSLLYNRNNADAEGRAGSLAAALRDSGVAISRSIPVDRRATSLVVRYFFAEDRDGANSIARRLSGLLGQGASVEMTRRDPMPVPGSVEALLP